MRVLIASPLLSYTGASEVEVQGATLGELLAGLLALTHEEGRRADADPDLGWRPKQWPRDVHHR